MRQNVLLLAVAIATVFSTLMTPASAHAANCGDPASMILTLGDFGKASSNVSLPLKAYNSDSGSQVWYMYQRTAWDEMYYNPYGAYVYGVTATSSSPAQTYRDLLNGELGKWDSKEYWTVDLPQRGEEMAVYQRLTRWDFFPDDPMVETLIAMRKGCGVHVMAFVMSADKQFDPKATANRYADIMSKRLG